MKQDGRIVVAGGGLAGLTAAIYAARAGRDVELIERMSEPGGRARTRDEAGYRFNMGPHALYRKSVGMAVLDELGLAPDGAAPPLSGARASLGHDLHALPGGFVSLLTTGLLSLGEKLETARFLATLPRLDTAQYDDVPIRQTLERLLRHPRVRDLAGALIRLTSYTHDPEHGSGGAALRQVQRSLDGVLYLHGGWQSLVEQLRGAARDAGVRFTFGAAVQTIERGPSDGRVRGVRLADGSARDADAVVVAAGPRELSALVDAGSDTLLQRQAEQSTPVCLSTLDVGLSSLPERRNRFTLGIDAPTYFSVHSGTARLAPGDGVVLHMSRYLTPGEKPERDEVKAGLEACLDRLQPGWRERVVAQRFLHPLVVTNAAVLAERGGLAGRPQAAVAHVPGLFVAGDWVGPHGQLADASLASARDAARGAIAASGARSA